MVEEKGRRGESSDNFSSSIDHEVRAARLPAAACMSGGRCASTTYEPLCVYDQPRGHFAPHSLLTLAKSVVYCCYLSMSNPIAVITRLPRAHELSGDVCGYFTTLPLPVSVW